MGAPLGAGTLNIAALTSSSMPRRPPPLSPMATLRTPYPVADMYPTFTPLQQSYAGLPSRPTNENRRPLEISDLTILDDDFQECWWAQKQDGTEVYVLSWATKQVDRAVIYMTGSGIWTGTIPDFIHFHLRLAEEARVKREAGQLSILRRVEATRKGAAQYL